MPLTQYSDPRIDIDHFSELNCMNHVKTLQDTAQLCEKQMKCKLTLQQTVL
jgi:hypothetical protein